MNMRMINDITNFIFIEDNIYKADAILIPGGSDPELGEYAAKLYKDKYAKIVVPSGGTSIKTGKFNGVKSKQEIYNREYLSDWEFLNHVLTLNGVPEEAIIREDKSGYTKENALFTRQVLDNLNITIHSAIICCKNFHARRALMCYQFAFPCVEFYVYPIPFTEKGVSITKENWYKTDIGLNRVLGEMMRYSNQFTEEFRELKESFN